MTREEAIEIIQKLIGRFKSDSRTYKALEMAIQALSQEPITTTNNDEPVTIIYPTIVCDDAISREDAREAFSKWFFDRKDLRTVDEVVDKLPPVTQKSAKDYLDMADRKAKKIKDALTDNPQKSGKWIPVSERLPEDAQEVLYSTKTGRVFHGEYYDDNTDRKWFSYKDDIFSFNNVVTAWMPLPEPYKAGSEDTE